MPSGRPYPERCQPPPSVARADPAAPGPWRSLLENDSAPDWRGWKEPGFPAGWHVAGGVSVRQGPGQGAARANLRIADLVRRLAQHRRAAMDFWRLLDLAIRPPIGES